MTSEDQKPDQKAPGASARARSAARLRAVQALYELEVAESPLQTVIDEFMHARWDDETAAPDSDHFVNVVKGVTKRKADIDPMIAAALSADWTLDRLETVLRAVLRAGVYELLSRADIPVKVVISEYMEVAHAFFDKGEPGMVNGILDRIARNLRDDEIPAEKRK